MAYSFYGGKEGRSFAIVARYDSIQNMMAAFSQGGAYTDVGFGEYVLIDTASKMDFENGCLFRRGFNYNETIKPKPVRPPGMEDDEWGRIVKAYIQNPGAGAEYIGQIVGPQGSAADVEAEKWSEFLEDYEHASQGKKDKTTLDSTPGFDGTKFNDEIQFGYCSLINEDGQSSQVLLGFDIPYTVFKFGAAAVSPYGPVIEEVESLPVDPEENIYYKVTGAAGYKLWDTSINDYVDAEPWTVDEDFNYDGLIREEGISQDHPYYKQYEVKVPKGIKGDTVAEVGIYNATSEQDLDKIHDYEFYYDLTNYEDLQAKDSGVITRHWLNNFFNTIFNTTPGYATLPVLPNLERLHDYNKDDKVKVVENTSVFLEALTNGQTAGNIPVDLTAIKQGNSFIDGTVKWKIWSLNSNAPQTIDINYTVANTDSIPFRSVDQVQLDTDGRIYVKYSDINERVYIGDSQSIIGVGYNNDPRVCRYYFTFNLFNTNALGNIVIDNQFEFGPDGSIIKYPTTDNDGHIIKYIDQKFIDITSVSWKNKLDNENKNIGVYLNVNYNDGSSNELDEFVIKGLDKVEVKTIVDPTTTKPTLRKDVDASYVVGFDNNDDPIIDTIIAGAINDIADITLLGDNLLILYSDPTVRDSIPTSEKATALSTRYNATFDNWHNLGAILKGNHVFGVFDGLTNESGTGLKDLYPYGFGKDTTGAIIPTEKDFMGWVAIVKEIIEGQQVQKTYAFDYHSGINDWVELKGMGGGTISDPRNSIIAEKNIGSEAIPQPEHDGDLIQKYGIWFVLEE